MKFQDLGLSAPLLRAVEEKGYETPTPIQEQAIPPVLQGRDLQGCAQTGTGKTAAFTLPILQLLAAEPPVRGRRPIRALVLTPTRELAIQIDECCRDYARYTPIRHCVIFGGVNQRPQVEALERGVDLLVATPGRLLDLIGQGYISLDAIRFFVLDEADRMLDMGFIHDIRRILPLLPAKRQTLFFSATMPADIAALAARILHDPVLVAVTPPASVVETISQRVYFAEKSEKSELLIRLLRESEARQVLVFTRTKHGADRLARILNRAGVQAAAIHGNKSQNARVRAMNDFKSGACRVLIATDIAARGIDIDQLPLVVNYDLPEVAETYVHRIGRTGRAGHEGSAWSFCSEAELEYLIGIQKLTGLILPVEGETPAYAVEALEAAARRQAQAGKRSRGSKRAETKRTADTTPKAAEAETPAPLREVKRSSATPQTPAKKTTPKAATKAATKQDNPVPSEASAGSPAATRPSTPDPAPKASSKRRRRPGRGGSTTAAPSPEKEPKTTPSVKPPKDNVPARRSSATKRSPDPKTAGQKQPAPAARQASDRVKASPQGSPAHRNHLPRRNRHSSPTERAARTTPPANPNAREENRISRTNDWKKRVKSLLLRTFGK